MSTSPMVVAEGVSKRFGSNEVLKGISLTVQRGEVLCIVGPSGSGKSTFCGVSITSSKWMPAACPSMANSSATSSAATSCTS